MPERLFLFVQFEFPWQLGPPDGRYLLRSVLDGEPERVVVLGTLGDRGASSSGRPGPLRRRSASRRRSVPALPEPAAVTSSRATIVDPIPLSAERQAQAWLADLDAERDVAAAVTVLNRVLHAQRIATADPYVREVSATQASTIRAGWGEGEQVAEGRWLHAVELPAAAPGGGSAGALRAIRARSAALRPHERLARLLGAHERPLLCEELALRARLDLDQNRIAHAALELDRAYSAALIELADERPGDLPLRVAELASLREGVARAARGALPDVHPEAGMPEERHAPAHPREADEQTEPDQETIRHALGRLEAALRARSAAGFDRA
ncbi:MAG TPA: hypothetical protein VES65_11580 [Solirubrobacteraceae bacterium]|nr:hypothetical protein [Solirubrobacteraceae bacterium]